MTSFVNSLIRAHLEWIYRIASTRPRALLGSFLLAIVLSASVVATTRFEADIFQLFPTRQPALKLLLDSLEWTGSAKEVYFLLEGEKDALPGEAEQFAARLKSAQVKGKPAFKRVTWRVYDQSEAAAFTDFIAYAATHPQLFLGADDVPKFLQRFTPAAAENALLRLQSELAGQFGSIITGLATADPLYLRDLILPRLKAGMQALDLDHTSPYFLSRDGKVLIMIAEPARPVQDMVFARALVESINKARKGSKASISCAGAHISAVLDEAAMKSNILSCILSSLVVVLLIFYFAYRRILPTLLLPLVIVSGVLLALGVAGAILPSIHIISFAFMALIIGLGADYSIHLYDRFHSERAAGKETGDALKLAVVGTGHGLFTAATTTAIPFLALMISDVRALYELGLLVGLGVLFSLYATLFLLPPLLLQMEKKFPIQYRPIPALGLGRLWRFTARFPRTVLACSLAVVLFLAFFSTRIFFDGELKNLQPRDSEAFLTQQKIERHLSLAPKQLLVAVEGKDLADLLRRGAAVDDLAEKRVGSGKIVAWSSLGQVLNNSEEQGSIRSAVAALTGNRPLPVGGLAAALEKTGFLSGPFEPFMQALSGADALAPVSEEQAVARLKASPLHGIVDRHLVSDKDGYHALFYLHYNEDRFDEKVFLQELHSIDPAARVTSVDMVSRQLADSVQHSFSQVLVIGGAVVLLLLFTHFGTASGIFYSLFPVVAGAFSMLGAMALLGMGLNFMNVMVLVTIVGMGCDYGLHVRHRVSATDAEEREKQYVQATRAVLLSALTTIAGFGSLALADYPALSSMGWATNFGIGFTALFALVTIPAVMNVKGKPS